MDTRRHKVEALDSLRTVREGFSVTTPAHTVFEARTVADNELVNSNNARVCGVIGDSEHAEFERQVGILFKLLSEMEAVDKELHRLQQPGNDDRSKSEKEDRGRVLQENMKMVRNALARWGTPSFGKCSRCRRPIHQERIEKNPWLDLCVECSQEIKWRQRSRSGSLRPAMAAA